MKSFIKQNIFIRQCDLNNLSPFVCEGDISERNITFVVRASKGMPDIDVIKKIYLTGNPGSSTLTVTYNALGGILSIIFIQSSRRIPLIPQIPLRFTSEIYF
jgi:hypothetical protein